MNDTNNAQPAKYENAQVRAAKLIQEIAKRIQVKPEEDVRDWFKDHVEVIVVG